MSDWQRLGKYVLARRVQLGFKQRGDFADAVGITARVVSDLENGRRGNFDPVTIASMEDVLGWETGSAAAVAAGSEPRQRMVGGGDSRAGDRRISDEIEMIYASKTMTDREKLRAIQIVLELRANTETAEVTTEAFNATVATSQPEDDNAR